MTLLKAANHFIDSVENGKFVLSNSAKTFQLCLNPRLRSNSYENSQWLSQLGSIQKQMYVGLRKRY